MYRSYRSSIDDGLRYLSFLQHEMEALKTPHNQSLQYALSSSLSREPLYGTVPYNTLFVCFEKLYVPYRTF